MVYEKNHGPAGTWLENKYPGAACEWVTKSSLWEAQFLFSVPAPIYAYTFHPNPDYSQYYATSNDIEKYLVSIFEQYKLAKYVKFGHRVSSAIWNETTGKWDIEVVTDDGQIVQDRVEVLINATGPLNAWKWPKIKGLEKFKGHLVHSAAYDTKWDATDKNVALIGSGSSSVQILPSIQAKAKHVDAYMRSAFWIVDPMLGRMAESLGLHEREKKYVFTEEEVQKFKFVFIPTSL